MHRPVVVPTAQLFTVVAAIQEQSDAHHDREHQIRQRCAERNGDEREDTEGKGHRHPYKKGEQQPGLSTTTKGGGHGAAPVAQRVQAWNDWTERPDPACKGVEGCQGAVLQAQKAIDRGVDGPQRGHASHKDASVFVSEGSARIWRDFETSLGISGRP